MAVDSYDAEHLREALARDPRVSELDIHVTVAGDALFITGTVPTAERREAISTVCAEILPGVRAHNDVVVGDYDEPAGQEVVS